MPSNSTQSNISRLTVGHMIGLFNYLYRGPRYGARVLDLRGLRTILFTMGFDQRFISTCEDNYFWDFDRILPALHDGSFYGLGYHGTEAGQSALHGRAVYLRGTLTEYPPSAEALIALDKSLFADGYRFANGRLVDVNQNIDTEVPAELEALPNNKALLEDLARNLSAKQLVVAEASATAERIRTKIDGLKPFGGTVKVTTSIGVEASETEGLSSPNALLDAADKAKYAAKFTTKNRICAWPLSPAEADAAATRKDGLAHSSESVLPRRTYARENGVS